jgi:L-galactono-1,4-lactone dehydrogenase
VGWSDTKLQFECGGQQWVSEVGFSAGSFSKPNGADLEYMARLLALIESAELPAPAPIEQRWTSGSPSKMSIAAADDPCALFSWVGIIMYLPSGEPAVREAITEAFFDYRHACEDALWQEFGAVEHWAKVETRHDEERRERLRTRLASRFPVHVFNAARASLDPKNILANTLVEDLFPSDRCYLPARK